MTDPRQIYGFSGLLGLLAAATHIGLHTRMRDERVRALAEASD